jgi:hypothetical protein
MNASCTASDPLIDLQHLLASLCPLIVIETRDEARALGAVRDASLRVHKSRHWAVFQWTVTEGLERIDVSLGGAQKLLAEPQQLLRHLRATPTAGIYVLLDFHPYLADPVNVRMLRDIAQGYSEVARTIVLVAHELRLPAELEHLAARLPLQLPTREERRSIVKQVAADWSRGNAGRHARIDPKALELLVENLHGLSALDSERLARQAIFNDGVLAEADLPGMLAAKYQLLNRGGSLSYEPDTARFVDVGGMRKLRAWLRQREPAFDGRLAGLDAPRGVLLLGVQGCGKSLAARAAAGLLGVPLLRLDFGALYSKWHGESERNLRESLAAADALAPCVLWIDEIEKALSAGDSDGGTSRRVLGSFLTWLAEKRGRVFVVATANEIAALPPELVRKGRFDEIFFVDLPDAAARAAIFDIHCRKRRLAVDAHAARELAAHSEGYTGAEIEQAVVAALYTAHSHGQAADAAAIARELRATRPLSIVMAEKVAALRAWAQDRTVPAD